MVADLTRCSFDEPRLPPRGRLLAWSPRLLKAHARLQHLSFRDEYDATLFPSFRDPERCVRLIDAVSSSPQFDLNATLLMAVEKQAEYQSKKQWYAVATIQVVRLEPDLASVVNIAVLPSMRNRGIGTALLTASLRSLQRDSVQRVTLDVTTTNAVALRLYTQLGFCVVETIEKEIAVMP